jgi:glycosyltransferase involved in cell wall biosynthesis
MTLTVLNVAYPMAPAGPDAVGGAEQVLSLLDRALVEAGHRSIVLACEGSRTSGKLVGVPRRKGPLGAEVVRGAREHHARAIREILRSIEIDLVHLHGIDFHTYLPPPGVPVLATLHLPLEWYPREALHPARPDTWLQCVSARQWASCGRNPKLLAAIENGVPVGPFRPRRKRDFALVLSRICPEKGIHIAIDAAKRAGIALLIAGEVYGYADHERYFRCEVEPRLDRLRRFIGAIGAARKQRLLSAARCLMVPSLVAETSSLAAREALAAGTPVIAHTTGALVDTIEHGKTGFLVGSETEMADAIRRVGQIDPQRCWRAARERFALEPMIRGYFQIYQQLARPRSRAAAAGLQ